MLIEQQNNTPTPKPPRRSGWSPERRAKHSALMKQLKPWTKSTGPKSAAGKTVSSLNAYKHGLRGRAHLKLDAMLQTHRRFLISVEGLMNDAKKSYKRTIEGRTRRALTLSRKRKERASAATDAKKKLHFAPAPLINPPMWTVAALYRFVALKDLPALQLEIKNACLANGVCGTLLLAPEGVNGTIAGEDGKLAIVIELLDRLLGVRSGELKYSHAAEKPFLRLKIRVKKEIITMAAPEANPTVQVGTYVTAQDWNDLIADPDVTLIDTRNDYETAVGIFKGAIDPNIQKFTDFKDYVAEHLDPKKNKKIAMFCTGGIRCEKASSYMLAHGFEEVYHLQGGILKYLETVPAEQSKWEGECFVFDRRVAVGHGLEEGGYNLCFGCRFPVTDEDRASAMYEEGVSCPRCHAGLTEGKAASLRMRHSQFLKDETTI